MPCGSDGSPRGHAGRVSRGGRRAGPRRRPRPPSAPARLTGLAVRYPSTDPAAHPLTGTRAPDLALTGTDKRLFELLRPDAHLLLDLTPDGTLDRPTQGLAVHAGPLDRPPAAWRELRAALIRPDGHVAWAAQRDDTAEGMHSTQGSPWRKIVETGSGQSRERNG
ncbi:aromatic-ring hydroxylase C-terminal domain-containing protein [Streptomyces chartreusis]|uniref:aromatic-ring hydroxylase C-terminal domain-containing protein n=1 Tax=Streptomyces chartreusis TaxID=1969 RepID=UPI003696D323